MPTPTGRYWIATWSCAINPLRPTLADQRVLYCKGQRETGDGGFEHWQFVLATKKMTIGQLRTLYPGAHLELTRSTAAEEYVWKENTRVPDSQFEIGERYWLYLHSIF